MDDVSSDFVFGTLATDERRLALIKAERAGIAHGQRIAPPDPQPGQPVRVTVTLGPTVGANRVSCYFTADDSEPHGERGTPAPGSSHTAFERVGVSWDTLLWGYVEEWRAELPPQTAGTLVRYGIEAWSSVTGARLPYSEIVGATAGSGAVRGASSPGDEFLTPLGRELGLDYIRRERSLAYVVDEAQTPQWAREAIIYHVFVDRFAPGAGRPFAQAEPMGFYGGTLRGVIEQLPYIASLGTTAIWLSPIFPSPSHHGYDATAYDAIESRLGTAADLEALLDAAHARGMRVLLDYTANHASSAHPAFVSALADAAGTHGDWFTFVEHPGNYLSFFGVPELPQFDLDRPGPRAHLIEQACAWLRRGVDGFRLDYALGPSHAFWSAFRRATRDARPDCLAFGEVVDTADALRSYAGRLDGCLDFLLLQALRACFAFGTMPPSQLDTFLQRHLATFPEGFLLPSFLDNHDMNRFLWVVRGDARRLKLAALCQYTLPHPPVLYYGTEVGLSQRRDVRYADGSGHPEESRLPMLWGDAQNADLLAFYRQLGALRRARPAIWQGPRTTLLADDASGLYAYGCGEGAGALLVILNTSAQPQALALDLAGWSVALATDGSASFPAELGAYEGVALTRPAHCN